MPEKRVLMITKVNAVWSSIDEFHKFWEKESLPNWGKMELSILALLLTSMGVLKIKLSAFLSLKIFHSWTSICKCV